MRRTNAVSIALLLLLPLFISQNTAHGSLHSHPTLLLSTDETTYYLHEDVHATTVFLNGTTPISVASVNLEAVFPNGTPWFVWHNATDENGTATFKFRLDNCPQGEYTLFATAYSYLFGNASATTGFMVNVPETKPPNDGTLIVKTTPISARVFVNGVLWGLSPQNRTLKPGTYTVSYGDVEGFHTPAAEIATVVENSTTTVEGVYIPVQSSHVPRNGTLTVMTGPYPAAVFVNDVAWGLCPQSRSVQPCEYTVSFSTMEGFYAPNTRTATVYENQTTIVEGNYQLMPGVTAALVDHPELINDTHPFIINATEAGVYLKIYSISDRVIIVVRRIPEPADATALEGWEMLGDCVRISVNNTDVSINATMGIRYDKDDLDEAELQEQTLKIHFWNTTSNSWSEVETSVHDGSMYAWADVDHFSLWAVMGQASSPTRTPVWWVWAAVLTFAGSLAIAFLYERKRKAALLLESTR